MKLESQTPTIVLIGSFNPPIFHPLWLESKELISSADQKNSVVKFINFDIAEFHLDWAHVQVTAGRFYIKGIDPRRAEAIRDLTLGIFKILRETPLQKLGINLESRYMADSEDERNRLGYGLVPPDFWRKYLNDPGMRKLEVRERKRGDDFLGYFGAVVEPAPNLSEDRKYEVIVSTNDHYEIEDTEGIVNAEPIIAIIEQQWEASIKRSEQLSNDIVSMV